MVHPGSSMMQVVRENWFWAAVLRDHATFIHDSLAPQEQKAAERASQFQKRFSVLVEESQVLARSMGVTAPAGAEGTGEPAPTPVPERYKGSELLHYQQAARTLTTEVTHSLQSLKSFKEELLQKKLDGAVVLNLGPTLLLHMINEAEEGFRALSGAREAANLPAPLGLLHQHLFWLPDTAGHAAALHGGLDGVERDLLKRTEDYKCDFLALDVMARELYAMLQAKPRTAGPLRRLNREAMAKLGDFQNFLAELREQLEGHEILGTLTPLFADHMLREERYYQEKVALAKEQE